MKWFTCYNSVLWHSLFLLQQKTKRSWELLQKISIRKWICLMLQVKWNFMELNCNINYNKWYKLSSKYTMRVYLRYEFHEFTRSIIRLHPEELKSISPFSHKSRRSAAWPTLLLEQTVYHVYVTFHSNSRDIWSNVASPHPRKQHEQVFVCIHMYP
jgi:hypothetical protein